MAHPVGRDIPGTDPVLCPQSGELRAVHRQFADQRGQQRIAGIPAHGQPQPADRVAGLLRPVLVQLPGVRVPEDQPRGVRTRGRVVGARGVEVPGEERVPAPVPSQHVAAAAQHDDRGLPEGVQELPGGLAHPLGRGRPDHPMTAAVAADTSQVVQMAAFGRVEAKSAGQRVQHLRRRAARDALLQPRVVRLADSRQLGQLVPAQAGDPTALVVLRQPDLGGLELAPTCSQEPAQLCGVPHGLEYGQPTVAGACPCQCQAAQPPEVGAASWPAPRPTGLGGCPWGLPPKRVRADADACQSRVDAQAPRVST